LYFRRTRGFEAFFEREFRMRVTPGSTVSLLKIGYDLICLAISKAKPPPRPTTAEIKEEIDALQRHTTADSVLVGA